eukprot:s1468_g19.t1
MLEEVKKEYERRGKPMSFTGWGPEDVRTFMLEHMKKVKKGGDIGLYARLLPKRKSKTQPAPMPDWVTKGTKGGKEGKEKEASDDDTSKDVGSESEEDDGVTDEGWLVVKKKNRYYLQHKMTKESVELGPPEEESTWEVRLDEEEGVEYLVQEGSTDFEDVSCREFYNELKLAERMTEKPRRRNAPALTGMKPTTKPEEKDESKRADDDDDFGADDSEEEAEKAEEKEDDSDKETEPIPYVQVDEKDSTKMYLIFPNEVKELKLPTDRCTDWVVVAKTVKGGGKAYWLESKNNEKEAPRECQVLLQSRKVRDITDTERREKAMALKGDFESKNTATAAKKLEEEKEATAKKTEAEEKYKEDLRKKIEKEMEEDLKREKERKEKELQAKLEEKKKKEQEQKAKEEKEKEEKLRAEKALALEKEAKAKEEAKKQKEKAQQEFEAQMKKQIEQEMRAKLEAEYKEKMMESLKKAEAEEKTGGEAKPKIEEDEKTKAKQKGKEEKKKDEKTQSDSSAGGKKVEAQDPFAPYGNVKEWMAAEVEDMKKKDREKLWGMVRKREAREAKAKMKATTTALQDTAGNLPPELPAANLD